MPRRLADAVLVSAFIVALGAYTVTSLRNAFADRSAIAASFADLPMSKVLPKRIEEQFVKHIAGRDAIVRCYCQFKTHCLGVSPNPKVWVGRHGWLYFNHSADPGYMSPSDPALAARLNRWAHALTARRAWLAERGIQYLVVASPDKQTIYPELAPRLARRRGLTPLDHLMARCESDPDLALLDLRPPLRKARTTGPLYRLTDSHWNSGGIFAGYEATVRALARSHPGLAPCSRSAFDTNAVPSSGGDLARLLGLSIHEEISQLERMDIPSARPVDEIVVYQAEPFLAHVKPRVWINDNPNLPRVVLLGDSFADDSFCELLAEHCSRLVRVGSYQGQEDLIAREKPDVVICQFVERMLEGITPRGPR